MKFSLAEVVLQVEIQDKKKIKNQVFEDSSLPPKKIKQQTTRK